MIAAVLVIAVAAIVKAATFQTRYYDFIAHCLYLYFI